MKIPPLISYIFLAVFVIVCTSLLLIFTDLSITQFIIEVVRLLPFFIAVCLFLVFIIGPLSWGFFWLLTSQYASWVLLILCFLVSLSLWEIDNETVESSIKIDIDIPLVSQLFDNAKIFSESQRQIIYAGLLSCIPSWAARKVQKNFINWWCYSFLLFTRVELFIMVAYIRVFR